MGILIVLGLVFASAAAAEPVGVVDYVRGQAWIERGAARIPAKVGAPVEEGDRVRTGARSRLRIRLADGTLIQLGAQAELRMARLRPAREGGWGDALLEMLQGRARVLIEKLKALDARFQIRMRTAVIAVRGTDVLAQVEPRAEHVALLDGRVEVALARAPAIPVAAGEYLRVEAGVAQAPRPIPEDWLLAFIKDVGTLSEGKKRKKQDGAAPEAPDAALIRMLERLGAPMLLPQ